MALQEGKYTCARYNDLSVTVSKSEADMVNNGQFPASLNVETQLKRERCRVRSGAQCIQWCGLLNVAKEISYSQNPPDNP